MLTKGMAHLLDRCLRMWWPCLGTVPEGWKLVCREVLRIMLPATLPAALAVISGLRICMRGTSARPIQEVQALAWVAVGVIGGSADSRRFLIWGRYRALAGHALRALRLDLLLLVLHHLQALPLDCWACQPHEAGEARHLGSPGKDTQLTQLRRSLSAPASPGTAQH